MLPVGMKVLEINKKMAAEIVIEEHYLHRRPSISFAFGLAYDGLFEGVITIGVPASRHLQKSLCPSNPDLALELNRLWVNDYLPPNTESWFISRALKLMPPRIICSYADTAQGHIGYVYRASNWFYHGYTDMERKTPRFDYVVEGKHSRDAFRGGNKFTKIRRKPKYKYWTTTGNRKERRELVKLCGWDKRPWMEVKR